MRTLLFLMLAACIHGEDIGLTAEDWKYFDSVREESREQGRQEGKFEEREEGRKSGIRLFSIGLITGLVAGVLMAKAFTIPKQTWILTALPTLCAIGFLSATLIPCWRLVESSGIVLRFRPVWDTFDPVHSIQAAPHIAWDVMTVVYLGLGIITAAAIILPRIHRR